MAIARCAPPGGHSAYGPSGCLDIIEMSGAADDLITFHHDIFRKCSNGRQRTAPKDSEAVVGAELSNYVYCQLVHHESS